MKKQLNVRVDEEFIARLEGLSRKTGRPMGATLEAIGLPAIEEAEADLQFEAEALAAWEEYELTGVHVTTAEIDALFDAAHRRAVKAAAEK